MAEESAEFEESHKAWIESVLKEPMSFTVGVDELVDV